MHGIQTLAGINRRNAEAARIIAEREAKAKEAEKVEAQKAEQSAQKQGE